MTTSTISAPFFASLRHRWTQLACAAGVGLALAMGGGVSSPALAAKKSAAKAKSATMRCELWAVHASKKKTKQRIPASLRALSPELSDDQFAAFSSFELLEKKSLSVDMHKPRTQSFRAGYQMELNLVERAQNRLKVHVNLRRGRGSNLVNLDYWMNGGSLLMLVGGNYQGGKIVFATRCR